MWTLFGLLCIEAVKFKVELIEMLYFLSPAVKAPDELISEDQNVYLQF